MTGSKDSKKKLKNRKKAPSRSLGGASKSKKEEKMKKLYNECPNGQIIELFF